LLVPVGNPEELAKGIRRVAEDEGMRLRLVEAAYEDVQSRFSWERVIQQYRELLNIENASS
jgi:glycosyltransferase involved in cell wall biosynthesis